MERSTLVVLSTLLALGVLGTVIKFCNTSRQRYPSDDVLAISYETREPTQSSTLIDDIVTRVTPWIKHDNVHSNYFMSGRVHSFVDSSLVFIHHPRTGGSGIIECLNNISVSENLPMSPLMTSTNRMLWDSGNRDTNAFRDKIKIHRGKFSFGMCQNLGQKCSYFILLRDPLQRIASSHRYCQTVPRDETCGPLDARKVSLREWILSQNNVLFKQLLFSSTFCNNNYFTTMNISSQVKNFHRLSCWTKNNLILENLTANSRDNITQYIVNNLHKMISLIGLSTEIDLTLNMLEQTFKLPFTKCSLRSPKEIETNEEIKSNRVLSTHAHDESTNLDEINDDNDIQVLKDDIDIQQALSSDYAIYNEAKRIFHIQKQILINSVR